MLVLNRSILTEKVARRGFDVLREYSVSPLEVLFVRDVMSTEVVTVRPEHSLGDVYAEVERRPEARRQRLLPVVDGCGDLLGVVPWADILERAADADLTGSIEEQARARNDRFHASQLGIFLACDVVRCWWR